jgi:predicted adenine nucleotide alpha hydrolase (AANH) superfamily ATPase
MSLKDYAFTTKTGEVGGWAMGLKVINNNGHDRVVVFNNTNILVLDENLNKLASIGATAEETEVYALEKLYLNLSHTSGTKDAVIEITGGGFLPSEKLKIDFAGSTTEAIVNSRGRLKTNLTVPNKKGRVDIKATGTESKLTYSITFDIK